MKQMYNLFGNEKDGKLWMDSAFLEKVKGCIEMKLKKIMAVIAAVAMAAAVSVPVFAEDATPGEVAQGQVDAVVEAIQNGNDQAAQKAMNTITTALKDLKTTVSPEMHAAGLAYYDYLEANGKVEETPLGDGVSIRNSNGGTITLNSCTIDAAANTVTVDIDAVPEGDVNVGYSVTVDLPSDMTASHFKISMINEKTNQLNQSIAVVGTRADGSKYVNFWVPHFTTYQLTPVTLSQPSQGSTVKDEHPEIAEAIANGTWGQDENAAASANSGAAAVTENPIKKTGMEMSVVLFAVVAVAAIAVGGAGVAVSKSRKGE